MSRLIACSTLLALTSLAAPQEAMAQRQVDVSDCKPSGNYYICRQPDGRDAQFTARTYQRLKRQQQQRDPRLPPKARTSSGAAGGTLACSGDVKAALSPRSLERIDLRYNTPIGGLVMVRDCGTWQAFTYVGETMYQLDRVPANQRALAKADIAGKAGMSVDELERSLMLSPIVNGRANMGGQGVIVPRSAVYPYEEALKIDPDGVKGVKVPDPNRLKVLKVRQVPWAIAQTPEYQAEKAKRRSEQEALFAILLLDYMAAARQAAGSGENCREEVQPIGPRGQARPVVMDCD